MHPRSADLQPVAAIAPGELLTVFGERLSAGATTPPAGQFPTSLGGVSVAVNGIASPLLYVGPQQINLQAPFAIAGAAQANITFASAQLNLSDSRTLAIAASNPVAFLDTVTQPASLIGCQLNGPYGEHYQVYNETPLPLAFNADGSRNSCADPAAPGSTVTLYLAGLGVTSPAQVTGAVTQYPGAPLSLTIGLNTGAPATVVSASAAPGSISGVWQVELGMTAAETGAIPVSLSVGGVPVRDQNLTVWVK
jgi:uncharacterized protein (TIGR03437 family)